jgi:2-dehydropantoate 2-reductase
MFLHILPLPFSRLRFSHRPLRNRAPGGIITRRASDLPPPTLNPRFLIYGAGANGGPLGAYLHLAGFETVLLARGAHLDAIRHDGLLLLTPGERRRVPVAAAGHPRELQPLPGDVVALTMKTQDTEAAVRDLCAAGWDPDETPLFSVQNCLVNEPICARYFRRVYGVMIVIPGTHLEPGVVVNPIEGNHGYMDVGRWPRGLDDCAERFVAAMCRSGYAAFPHADVMASKAVKFLGNLGNALEAIADTRDGLEPFLECLRAEGRACLAAAGVPVEDEAVYRERVRAHRGTNRPVEGVSTKRSSTWQSLARAQGSVETDFLNGEVVLLGRLHGIPTPYNAVLQRVAARMARRREPPGRYSVADLTTMARDAESGPR